MTLELLTILGIVTFGLIAFAFELLRSDLVALLLMSLLILFKVLSPEDAVAGFSNPATLTVASMFIISAAFVNAGLIEIVSQWLIKWKNPKPGIAIFGMMIGVGVVSAFINNTAAVAVFIPVAMRLATLTGTNRQQFLMPLSFAAIFGGTCTLIGTSTNILVNFIYVGKGFSGFSMFEFAGIGLILGIIGIVYMMTIGRFLLKTDQGASNFGDPNKYTTEVQLAENSKSIGLNYKQSSLYEDLGQNILWIKRDGDHLNLTDDPILKVGDRIALLCGIDKIFELKERIGISILEGKLAEQILPKDLEVFEVVVPVASDLVGKRLNQSGLVRAHGIIPLAIRHRQRTLFTLLRGTRIQPGDVLVVAAKPETFEDFRHEERLIVLGQPRVERVNWQKLLFTTFLVALLVSLSSMGVFSVLGCAVLVVTILLVTKVISLKDAYNALDSQVLVLLGCILSLGLALEKSGGAAILAKTLVYYAGDLNPAIVVSIIYLVTSLMTEIMSNNATAALMAPIALGIASALNLSEKPFLIAVMLAGSASFMTPVGYQTNTLIFAPGGFKFSDFLKVGTPLNLIFWIVASFLIPLFFPF